jgi:Ni/Fe-hydrogenase subunit HybB-like protein
MTAIPIPFTKKHISIGTIILLLLFALGVSIAIYRWINGFSNVSNLSDSRPWGLWISFDLLVGVAISSGAFILAATVHIFHIKKAEPILRPALLTGFLGYLLVILALLVDLGQPQRLWHMIVYRNLHSPLFEVGMCVMAYTLVLFIEFSPPVLEKLDWQGPLRLIKRISIPVVILGVTLSTMHQSSLGSLFLIVPLKMHPLWYTPLLPLIFLVSAVSVGFGMVIFECVLSHRLLGGHLHKDILQLLAKGLFVTLGVLLLIKISELVFAGEVDLILEGSYQSNMFILENIVGIIIPLVILAVPRFRTNVKWIYRAGLLSVIGLILNRLNIGWTSMAGAVYTPHWMEVAVSVGLFSGGILIFGLVMKNLTMEGETIG